MKSHTLRDLCFLSGIICPIFALIMCFVTKNEEYKKSFRTSMIYGFALWVVVIVMLSMNMCNPDIYGISNNS